MLRLGPIDPQEYRPAAGAAADKVWRDGMKLVIAPRSSLPCRCLKCNAPAGGPLISRKISTFSAWYPLFSSAGWNSDSVEDRPIDIRFGLCHRHRLKWIAGHAVIGLLAMTSSLFFLIHDLAASLGPVADLLAVVLPMACVVISFSLRPLIQPRRVHHGLAWFGGAGREFLDSLPELTVPSESNQSRSAA
jgi:hypothetical protein